MAAEDFLVPGGEQREPKRGRELLWNCFGG